MNETELDQLAPTLFADARPAASLRARVLASAPQPQKTSSLRWGLAGGGLVAAGIIAASFLLRPKPAYADIERAMAAVQTAQWQVELTQWSDSGQKRQVTECVASRALPAIATRERGGQGYFSLLTPTLSLSYDRTRDVYLKETPIAAGEIRKHIQESFFPPSSRTSGSVPSSPYRWTPWQVVEAKLEGKPVLRFHQECHYQSESYATTLWADPKSRRLIRRESEMAWRGYRSKTVASQFRYDQPLPADAFALTVAKGKRVFVNDHHFYPGAHTVTPKELELVQLYNLLHWLDGGWAARRADIFVKAFDFGYLPTLYNGIISPSPQKRTAQQEQFWRNRLAQVAKTRPRWDKWVSRVVSVEEQASVRILGMTPFCLPEGDPPVWKVSVAVVCEAHQGKFPVYDGTTGYTLWVRRKGGTFRVIYAELDERFGEESHSPQRLFD